MAISDAPPRVACVSHGSPDYLVDVVTDGLVRTLGRERVHLDYRIGGPCWDARVTHLFQGFEGFNAFPLDRADCLVASVRVEPELIDRWRARTDAGPVAVLDGEDDDVIREEFRRRATVYFKREFLRGADHPRDVHPLPFGAIPEPPVTLAARERAVFFRASDTDPLRSAMAAALRARGHEVAAGALAKAEYNRRLASSLVCPSARGAGWDTYRYWEIPLFGSVLLSQRLPLVIEDDFVDGEEAVFFDGLDEFTARLDWLLAHPGDAERIARAGQRKCRARHLSIHRAATVLDAVRTAAGAIPAGRR